MTTFTSELANTLTLLLERVEILDEKPINSKKRAFMFTVFEYSVSGRI